MKTALTIAGSDSSGGAGIQADIKTMTAHRVYAMSAVTALTAQNTTGVTQIFNVSAEFLEKQIDAVFTDIYPDAVKIGMVSEEELIKVIAKRLIYYKAGNIVIDPVMVSTSGARLISENAVAVLRNTLLPLADLITPNIPEAEVLTGRKIEKAEDMEAAAAEIYREFGCSVLLKGGHQIENPNTHGTGCTLSSAIASNLAKGKDMEHAVAEAKNYISLALGDMLNLGKGSGPMNHAFAIEGEYKTE